MSRSGAVIRTSGNPRVIAEWISGLANATERSGFFQCVTERSGSDICFREKSRIVTERIPAATNVTERCGLIEPLRKKQLRGYILTPYASFFAHMAYNVCALTPMHIYIIA